MLIDMVITKEIEKSDGFGVVKQSENRRLCSHWANRGSAGGNTACRCLYEAADAPEQHRTGDGDLIRPESRVLGRACLQRSKRRRHRSGLKRSATGA